MYRQQQQPSYHHHHHHHYAAHPQQVPSQPQAAPYYMQQQPVPQPINTSLPTLHQQSHSSYLQQQSQTRHQLPTLCTQSISQPIPQHQHQQQQHAKYGHNAHYAPPQQSGIVLQSLGSSNNLSHLANIGNPHLTNIDSQQLQQFANYSQHQLQAAIAQYPPWLQKEYMRRLQRQYEEIYVVEDPKIHHWSSICPRDTDNKCENPPKAADSKKVNAVNTVNNENSNNSSNQSNSHLMTMTSESELDGGRSSCGYYSESCHSVTISPSPYAYSPHHRQTMPLMASPQPTDMKDMKEDQDGIAAIDCTAKSAQSTLCKSPSVAATTPGPSRSMLTCFQILDYIAKDNDKDDSNDETEHEQQQTEEVQQEEEDKDKVFLQQDADGTIICHPQEEDEEEEEEEEDVSLTDSDEEEEGAEINEHEQLVVTPCTENEHEIDQYITSPPPQQDVQQKPVQQQAVNNNNNNQQNKGNGGYYTTNVVPQQQQQQQQLDYQHAVQQWYAQQQQQQQKAVEYQQMMYQKQQQQQHQQQLLQQQQAQMHQQYLMQHNKYVAQYFAAQQQQVQQVQAQQQQQQQQQKVAAPQQRQMYYPSNPTTSMNYTQHFCA